MDFEEKFEKGDIVTYKGYDSSWRALVTEVYDDGKLCLIDDLGIIYDKAIPYIFRKCKDSSVGKTTTTNNEKKEAYVESYPKMDKVTIEVTPTYAKVCAYEDGKVSYSYGTNIEGLCVDVMKETEKAVEVLKNEYAHRMRKKPIEPRKPYLYNLYDPDDRYGTLGEETYLIDIGNKRLKVGDVVDVIKKVNGHLKCVATVPIVQVHGAYMPFNCYDYAFLYLSENWDNVHTKSVVDNFGYAYNP